MDKSDDTRSFILSFQVTGNPDWLQYGESVSRREYLVWLGR